MCILGGEFLEGEFLRGLFLLEKLGATKKNDPRIQPQNSGLKNLHARIRPQVRVDKVQNPLCGNWALTY